MKIRRSSCFTLFAVLLLAAASWTALAAQAPSQAREVSPAEELSRAQEVTQTEEVSRAEQVSRSETPAAGENNGAHTLAPTELEVARRAIVFPPRPIKPAQVQPGDHVASGISLRNRGGGVINLRGAPASATPVEALLYWDVLDNTAASSMTVSLNGVAVSGTKIGQGPGPCWGTQFNAAYRANVPLYLLYIGINGDYKIAGVPSSKGTGDDPWQSSAPAPLAEGATLVVIYRHAGDPFTKTYIYEAPIAGTMFFSNFATTLGGFSPPAPLNQAKFTLIGADGQVGVGLAAGYTVTAEKSFFQGQQIAGPGSTNAWVDNDSDWNGQDVEPLNQLWDTRTHVVPIKPGSTSAPVQYVSQGDCLVTVAFVLSL